MDLTTLNLKQFCCIRRESLRQPFSECGRTVVTNGVVLLRFHDESTLPEQTDRKIREDVRSILAKVLAVRPESHHWYEAPEYTQPPPYKCEYCEGKGRCVECPDCKGFGFDAETQNCAKCEGLGLNGSDNPESPECEYCEEGYVQLRNYPIDMLGTYLSSWYVDRLRQMFGKVEYYLPPRRDKVKEPVPLRFEGGEGVIMPMKPLGDPDPVAVLR